MSRYDSVMGKAENTSPKRYRKLQSPDLLEQVQESFTSEGDGSVVSQTTPTRTLLIRGPNGYTVITPIRNLETPEMTEYGYIQIKMSRNQAQALINDVLEAQKSNGR